MKIDDFNLMRQKYFMRLCIYCSGIWYRPAYQGTTVVYIVDTIDSGANTNIEFEEYD
jgi:hypothetical protein